MKLFFGGSAAFAATLLSASVLFYAKPLFAEGSASHKTASTQQEKTDPTPVDTLAQAETPQALEASLTATPVNAPTTTGDSNPLLPLSISEEPPALPAPVNSAPITESQHYVATAYSLPGRTASGMRVAKGIIAADPRVLPMGTRVRLEAGPYSGEYLVADTGSAVRGRKIDVWVPSYSEACRFGRRSIKLSVLSYGKRRTTATRARRRS
jgi:3D (Asp-Asp-Asp) domain-containing protein